MLTRNLSAFRVLREQWIRAKYERKEFSESAKHFEYEEGECTPTNACEGRHSSWLCPGVTSAGSLQESGMAC